jgi:hypothetical protein
MMKFRLHDEIKKKNDLYDLFLEYVKKNIL